MTLRTANQLGLMFRWLVDDVSAQVLNVQTAINEIAQGKSDLSSHTWQAAATWTRSRSRTPPSSSRARRHRKV
jgi:aerotaxis receptor